MTMVVSEAGDPRLAVNAGPLLHVFNAAGVISAADVHVAQRLGRLTGEGDERVLLAVALAVRGVRAGSVCVRLDELDALAQPEAEDAAPVRDLPWPDPAEWRSAVEASPLVAVGVGGPADRPARWVDGRLYLDRYWRDERRVRCEIDARLGAPLAADTELLATAVRRLFPEAADDRQRLATAAAVLSRLTVLTGGPGTGKTTTVARMIAALQAVAGPDLRVALAAPTGKAAARLQEAVRQSVSELDPADSQAVGELEATTIHRLLGWRPGSSTRFKHNAERHLPHDVVIVDETSMVSLPLMARLLEALRPQARLVLVGDPDQLASVEAGAVLGDLVERRPVVNAVAGAPVGDRSTEPPALPKSPALPEALTLPEPPALPEPAALPEALAAVLPGELPTDELSLSRLRNGVVRLEKVHRFKEGIAELADAIRRGDANATLAVLRRGLPDVELVEIAGESPAEEEIAGLRADATNAGVDLVEAARAGDRRAALEALERHRLLLAHRRGPAGVAFWAPEVQWWVAQAVDLDAPTEGWYPGRPLLVTTNDRDTGLYNGDTGVIVADGHGGVVAVFGDPRKPVPIRPHRLPTVETVHAMTVHRAQGSQFAHVSLILPPATSPLLTRELLYTAVTRARDGVRVVANEASIRKAIENRVRRASGLQEPL